MMMTTTSIQSSVSLLLVLIVPCTITLHNTAVVLAYRTLGFPCRADFQCESGYCNATRQCQAQGEIGQACAVHEACLSDRCSGGVCQIQRVNGTGPCDNHNDCLDGFCNYTTSICDVLKIKQSPCVNDYECVTGRCTANPRRCEFVIYEDAICGKNSDCYGGRCKKVEQGGDNRCYPRKWNSEPCNHNEDCLSLRCEAQNCTEPVGYGQPCDEASDCYSLLCNTDTGCVFTSADANTDLEPNFENQGITGSEVQEIVNGGGSVDVSQGTVFVAEGTTTDSGATATIPTTSIYGWIYLVTTICGIVSVVATVRMN